MATLEIDIHNPNLNKEGKVVFTYDQLKVFAEYPEGPLIELINGDIFMPPSPSTIHQRVSFKLERIINAYLDNNPHGELFHAPFDVLLSDNNVVIPDIFFVRNDNKSIIGQSNIKGSPDLIIEILSSNKKIDLVDKKLMYEEFKVKEYWIVSPIDKNVIVYKLKNLDYAESQIYDLEDTITSSILVDIQITVSDLFE